MRTSHSEHGPGRSGGWLLLTFLISAVVPAAVLVVLGRRGLDISGLLVFILLGVVAIDTLLLLFAGSALLRTVRLPRAPLRQYPPASAVVLAAAGAPPDALRKTVGSLLSVTYVTPLHVVVACGSEALATEADACSGNGETRARVVLVEGGSPLDLFAAALAEVRGAFVGIFEPGQRPQRGVFTRAWIWLSHGFDLVHAAIRADNAELTLASRLGAVDLVGIDAPLYPLPAGVFGVAGGSMFVTTSLARSLVGPAVKGVSFRSSRDPLLRVWESVPSTLGATWRRWIAQEMAYLAAPRRARTGGVLTFYRVIWRPVFTWLSPAVFAAAGYYLARMSHQGVTHPLWPVIALLVLTVIAPGVLRTLFAYLLADDDVRRHRRWFAIYALAWIAGLGAMRNSATRVAQSRLALGRRRRATAPALGTLTEPGVPVDVETEPEGGAPPDEVIPPAEPASVPAVPERAPLSPAAQRLVAMADCLPDAIAIILRDLDAFREERALLCRRIDVLERAVAKHEAENRALLDHASNTIEPAALRRLQETVSALHEEPGNVVTLSEISEQAESLGRVVDGYAQLQAATTAP